jgi:5-oxoprolinase (ATP-hydrolysing)
VPASYPSGRWRFCVDRGGTFTDCIGIDPRGVAHVTKVLSSDDAPLLGIRTLLGLPRGAPIPPCEVRLGTTIATNALLERRGAPTLLVTSCGFADLLAIGTQARPDIFALRIVKPGVLQREVLELDARADPEGRILARPDERPARLALEAARARGLESVAISVLHAYAAPELELQIGEWARAAGFAHVRLSHQAASEIGFLRRTQTAVLDAYLAPLLTNYLDQLERELPGSDLLLMQSSGELCRRTELSGANALLSGPAGGVVALAEMARASGARAVVGFDMGGTSTDVSRFAGEHVLERETTVAGIEVTAPLLGIHTVAAGGGSLVRYDGHTLKVGPESAGADPGPLCYGKRDARELTITDVNLLLGRLQPDHFPFPLDRARAALALERLAQRVCDDGHGLSVEAVASGALAVANANMAAAIAKVSLERGYDVRNDTLVVFGGAGGQHATAVARLLGVKRIWFHSRAGVLSAHGLGLASWGWHGQRDIGRPELSETSLARARRAYSELEREARAMFGARPDIPALELRLRLDLRYAGTETAITLDIAAENELRATFITEHRRRFGFANDERTLVVSAVRLEARLPRPAPGMDPLTAARKTPRPLRYERVYCSDGFSERVPVYERDTLPEGFRASGPLCVLDTTGSIVVDPGFALEVQRSGLIEVRAEGDFRPSSPHQASAASDPVTLELFGNAFMGVAERMGALLRSTAESTNIRERLDFSCAVFDGGGRLVANAPHIPVHLGAMSESVKEVHRRFPNPAPGDVFVTNSPYEGGSHLPDITVVTPVFSGSRVVFFTASRGHHADVGGTSPGSMPAFSTTLAEEGVLLSAQRLVERGEFAQERLLAELAKGPYPARNPAQNIADLKAQVAANHEGVRGLERLFAEHGEACVTAYAHHLQQDAARRVRELLLEMGSRSVSFDDALDDGTPIGVTLTIDGGHATVEFRAGSEHDGNANAPRAISVAAVIYVFCCLSRSRLPLNAGLLDPVTLVIPERSLLDPAPGRAVVSGNVETSQRIVDILLGAFGAVAASQGTMNNLTFGSGTRAYYETLGGGSGAGPTFDGASGVQCHMTNTRVTDVELLEAQHAVRVRAFSLRAGSGGHGRHRGGDGLVRELEFLSPTELALTSERRLRAPFGLAGGGAGARGRNVLNGKLLPSRYAGRLAAGDILRIETPGGGGYGSVEGTATADAGGAVLLGSAVADDGG